MSQNPFPNEPVDQALSDFFQSAMPKTWPAAPRLAEPASVIAARPAPDRRARVTLAASVAVLLGICLYAASGLQPAPRPAGQPPALLQDGSAKMPNEFKKVPPPMLD